jgi:hypothetical protein
MSEVTLETIFKEIKDVKELVEALSETFDIISNPRELREIRKSLMDIKKKRTRSWDEFEQELKKEGKL